MYVVGAAVGAVRDRVAGHAPLPRRPANPSGGSSCYRTYGDGWTCDAVTPGQWPVIQECYRGRARRRPCALADQRAPLSPAKIDRYRPGRSARLPYRFAVTGAIERAGELRRTCRSLDAASQHCVAVRHAQRASAPPFRRSKAFLPPVASRQPERRSGDPARLQPPPRRPVGAAVRLVAHRVTTKRFFGPHR
jgi:hypothetical protein